MKEMSLNGDWTLNVMGADGQDLFGSVAARVPGTVYTDLLREKKIADPFYRDQELSALKLMEHRFSYERSFTIDSQLLEQDAVLLRCMGLDTLATLSINGQVIGETENMHRTYEFAIKPYLRVGDNVIRIEFDSPTQYIEKAWQKAPIHGSDDAMRGFPYLRKAHCMFGWDWGPRLPDAGIWRDIKILAVETARIQEVYVRQEHIQGTVRLHVDTHLESWQDEKTDLDIRLDLFDPDGQPIARFHNETEILISQPQLWWPRGYGQQPLYRLQVRVEQGGEVLDGQTMNLGLRTLTVRRKKDEWGESFMHVANGIPIFAMGADYIPEDNLLGRRSRAKTEKLLRDAVQANFNCIRVWGGGHYPDDWFYDLCDELGLIVWQDFMFACATYELTPDFKQNIRQECIDNIIRLRHHASLALWCGNNEMEMFQENELFKPTPKQKADYIRMFEALIPEVLEQYDPHTFYWPASPSSGGGFDAPNDPNRGDVHYWDVWHGDKPFSDYRNYYFRYASEFGFQAFPAMQTIESFTLPQDRNIFSRIMEMHQRNKAANGKIMNYLAATYLYPKDLTHLVYASQLLQAEAIQYGVEHWRRHRGRCMGAIYWQLNDCWPVASWASIDYYGRWKALHHYARRFFAPVLLSCEENGEMTQRPFVNMQPQAILLSARLAIANETREEICGTVHWSLRDPGSKVLQSGCVSVKVDPLSSSFLESLSFPEAKATEHYLSFSLTVGGEILSQNSVLFCAPKHFAFRDPDLSFTIAGDEIIVRAKNYARCVEIDPLDDGVRLSDNYFHLDGGSERCIKVEEGHVQELKLRSVHDIASGEESQ